MLAIGQTVYLWRRSRNLTQAELARRSGLSRPNLSQLEQGSRDLTVGTLRRLAEALEVRPGVLADGLPPGAPSGMKWGREELDQIARWVAACGRKEIQPSLSPGEKKIALQLQSVLKHRLKLASRTGRPLPRTARRRSDKRRLAARTSGTVRSARQETEDWLKLKRGLGPEVLKNLLNRVNKIYFAHE